MYVRGFRWNWAKVCTSRKWSPTPRLVVAAFEVGDIILKWNDHVATDPTLLSRAIAATKIGSTAKLLLLRDHGKSKSEELTLDIKVERRPSMSF